MAPTLSTRADEKQMGSAAPALLDGWIYFNLISNTILLPILVATFVFSKRAKRHPTLVNVCLTWVFSGIFSLLLYFTGQHKGPEPPSALCVAQASLMYGITPMWSVAILMMVYYMNLAMNGDPGKAVLSRPKLTLMLSAPYIVQLSFSIATLVLALENIPGVNRHRHFFYCSLKNHTLGWVMSSFTFIVASAIMALEINLAVMAYRNWRCLRRAGYSRSFDIQLLLRVLVFGIYVLFGIVVNIVLVVDHRTYVPEIYMATVGTVIFLVFGTQPDVFRAWCFWRVPPRKPIPVKFSQEPKWREAVDLRTPSTISDITTKIDLQTPPLVLIR